MAETDLLLPLALLVLVGLAVLGTLTVRRVLEADDRRAALLSVGASDAFTVGIVFASCYAALTSSRNAGVGFTFPITMLLPPLAVMSLRRVPGRELAASLVVIFAIVGLNVASNSNISDSLARARYVSVPAFGSLPWVNGIPQTVSAIRDQVPGPAARFVSRDRGWPEADRKLASTVVQLTEAGAHQPVAFASRNRALNTSTLLLAGLMYYHQSFALAQLTAEPNDSVATYEEELSSPDFGLPGILVTMSSERGDFEPVLTQRYAEIAARRAGFRRVRTMVLPDGRQLRVWRKLD